MTPPKAFDDVPMFNLEPVAVEKKQAAKTVASAVCPSHGERSSLEPKTGLVRHNNHLHWREHTVATWSGRSRVCVASLQALHDFPGRGEDDVTCPCMNTPAMFGGAE